MNVTILYFGLALGFILGIIVMNIFFTKEEKNLKVKCPYCGSNNLKLKVEASISIDPKDIYRVSNSTFKKESTEIENICWDKTQIICEDCGLISKESLMGK